VSAYEEAFLKRLCNPHYVHRTASFVSRDTDHRLDRIREAAYRVDEILSAADIGAYRLPREVLTGWNLLHRGGMENDIDSVEGGPDALGVTHVTDLKLHEMVVIVVDDFVCRDRPMLVRKSDVVLLGLVTREQADAIWHTDLAGQQATQEHSSQRAAAARYENALTGQHAAVRSSL